MNTKISDRIWHNSEADRRMEGEIRFLKDVVLTGIQEDLRIARQERDELKECLRWYVENDDTNEGGKWEESNASWLEGKRRAMRALGMEE